MITPLPTEPLPPDLTWTNGRMEQRDRTPSIYDQFTDIEKLLREAVTTDTFTDAIYAARVCAGRVLALKERVCALRAEPRERPRQYRVTVCEIGTGSEMFCGVVEAGNLKDAEQHAISKAALNHRGNPAQLEARHVHELCAACGQEMRGGAA